MSNAWSTNYLPSTKTKMKILITGAAGYLGRILYPILNLSNDHYVIGIDNYLYHQEKRPEIIKADITDKKAMLAFSRGIDVIIALAGIVGDPACGLNAKETIKVNQESTKLLAEVCERNKVKKLIFTSSCSVYGYSSKMLTTNSSLHPLSLYAKTKLESEKILLNNLKTCQLKILRLGTMFGYSPRMRFDLVVNIMTAMALKEKKIVVNGGQQWRPLIHVQNVANFIHKLLKNRQRQVIYNVLDNNYQIIDIAYKIINILKKPIKIIEKKSDDLRDYKVISSLPLNYTSLTKGIEEIIGFFKRKEFKNYKDKKYYNVEILKTL